MGRTESSRQNRGGARGMCFLSSILVILLSFGAQVGATDNVVSLRGVQSKVDTNGVLMEEQNRRELFSWSWSSLWNVLHCPPGPRGSNCRGDGSTSKSGSNPESGSATTSDEGYYSYESASASATSSSQNNADSSSSSTTTTQRATSTSASASSFWLFIVGAAALTALIAGLAMKRASSRVAIADINSHPLRGGVNHQYHNGPRGKVRGSGPSIFATETSGANTMSVSEGGEIEISGPSPIGFGSSTSPPSDYVRM